MADWQNLRIDGLDVVVRPRSYQDEGTKPLRALIIDHTNGKDYECIGRLETAERKGAIRFPLPYEVFDVKHRKMSIQSNFWSGGLGFEIIPRYETGEPVPIANDSGAGEASSITGRLEYFDGELINGWAYDQRDACNRVVLEIYIDNVRFAVVTADERRQELVKNGIGDGRCGFMKTMPSHLLDGQRHVVACVTSIGKSLIAEGLVDIDVKVLRAFVVKEIAWRIKRVDKLLEI